MFENPKEQKGMGGKIIYNTGKYNSYNLALSMCQALWQALYMIFILLIILCYGLYASASHSPNLHVAIVTPNVL